ncbi:MAG: nuclear transport factor 2 family protein [Woeseiaceae bacterium]|nr:nuclear transport factor 2 family protein [Woeseiaceae bacterium]
MTFCIAGLIACSAPTGEAPVADTEAARAQVDTAVTAMYQAYADNDTETYFSFFADDAMMLTDGGAEQPATEYEESWSSLIAAGGGVVSYDPNFPRSIRVSDDGKTAVVLVAGVPASYRFPDDSEAGKFNDASNVWAETIVWTENDGDWKLVHFHYHDVSD